MPNNWKRRERISEDWSREASKKKAQEAEEPTEANKSQDERGDITTVVTGRRRRRAGSQSGDESPTAIRQKHSPSLRDEGRQGLSQRTAGSTGSRASSHRSAAKSDKSMADASSDRSKASSRRSAANSDRSMADASNDRNNAECPRRRLEGGVSLLSESQRSQAPSQSRSPHHSFPATGG